MRFLAGGQTLKNLMEALPYDNSNVYKYKRHIYLNKT